MSSVESHVTEPFLNLLPEEMLDIALEKMQSVGINLVEWRTLLYRRMNVPRIVSVSLLGLFLFFHYALSLLCRTTLFLSQTRI
jgi:hypothetical protein